MRVVAAVAVLASLMATAAPGVSAQQAVSDVQIRRASSTIVLDGALDETAWRDAAPIALPFEIRPGDNEPARVATECRITFDDDRLYLGCHALDDQPELMRAFLTDRDDIGGQDIIGLMLDPFRDQRRAWAFYMNPLGVQADFVFDQGEANDAWNAIWDVEGHRTSDGYVVEAAIPFSSLRFPAGGSVQSWNFFVWRELPRSEAVSFRSVPKDPANQCTLCQLATATGIVPPGAGIDVELTPVATAQRADARPAADAAALARGPMDDQYGLDARWSVTPDLTLNATVNPDFSQVEADAQQVQSNQQFALFFPERRPFFIEGAELYQTPIRAVFTRSIADPSFGTRLTGKLGQWAGGALVARDETTNLLFPSAQRSSSGRIAQHATTLLGRLRRDLGGSHTVGALLTTRTGLDYHNVVAGADARVQLLGPLNFSGQALRSWTEYPAAVAADHAQPIGAFAANAASARLDFNTRNWFGHVVADQIDPGFRADAGFVSGADQRGLNWRIQRKWWLDDSERLTRFSVMGGTGWRERRSGEPLHRFVFADVNLQGALQSEIALNPDHFSQWFEGRRFEISRLNVFGGIQPTGRIEAGWFHQLGEAIDFANARESGLLRLGPWIDFRIGPRVNLELDYTLQRLTYQGERVFREQIGEVLLLYYFSRRAFLRGLVQLRDVVRDPALYRDPVGTGETTLATQFLFSYKLNPQSVAFLGYSDRSVDRRENRDPALGLVRMGRSFFLKLSYAWRP